MRRLEQQRVVVTGLGLVTALGRDVRSCWRRLLAGENGIRAITFWDPSEYNVKLAAEVPGIPLQETGSPSIPRNGCRRGVRLFVPAVNEAFADAQLDRVPLNPRASSRNPPIRSGRDNWSDGARPDSNPLKSAIASV